MSDDITVHKPESNKMPRKKSDDDPEIGKWYWVTDEEDDRWLGCVTHVGSNYVKIVSTGGGHIRIHFDDFWGCCEYVPDALVIIRKNADTCRARIGELTEELQLLTSRLGVAPSLAIGEGSDTEALSVRTGEPMPEYRESLVKAKDDKIPGLFKEIEKTAESMEEWLKAESIPLRGQRSEMNAMIDRVDRRILAVDLYAGISEDAVKIRDGDPADLSEPVRLVQRRHYMDEECLANYKHGGMDFRDIDDFDNWLLEDGVVDRLLPFQRCLVAFRVRRKRKHRSGKTISDFISIMASEKMDNVTFLYIRNGDQIWRVNTLIEFGEKLFPDSDRQLISSGQKMWVKVDDFGRVGGFISDNEYKAIRDEDARKIREWRNNERAWNAATEDEKLDRDNDLSWPGFGPSKTSSDYRLFRPEDIYYDDMVANIQKDVEDHNRVVMVLQGILDRSEILHPHPPWRVWTDDGFRAGIRLVFDQDRALVAGEKPDFEKYRMHLNESLQVGSVTIGQERYWMRREAKKENDRRSRDWRIRGDYSNVDLYSPYGNDGPGELAEVVKFMPRARKATFHWYRERQGYDSSGWGKERSPWIRSSVTCPESRLMNVSAYKPGDFRMFFDDPRTRAEYLKWAPMLLMAEEYHAGNKTVGNKNGPKEDE